MLLIPAGALIPLEVNLRESVSFGFHGTNLMLICEKTVKEFYP